MHRLVPALLVFCLWSSAHANEKPADNWWTDAVFYSLLVPSFKDTDGNGVGDLPGLIQQLDYLNDGNPNSTSDLGVTALLLMPIFDSSTYHGYNVRNYQMINPMYGTLQTFRTLIDEAHKRNMKVVLELPFNGTADDHLWFANSRRGDDNQLRGYYVWQPTKPYWKSPRGTEAWHASGTAFYYGIISEFMPDLNYNSADVIYSMKEVLRFWTQDMGVDGFRLQGAQYLIEEGPNLEHTQATHELLQQTNAYVKSLNPSAVVLGDVLGDPNTGATYVPRELDLGYESLIARSLLDAANTGLPSAISSALKVVTTAYRGNRFGNYLSNQHTDRSRTVLGSDVNRCRVAASLLFTSPGVPFMYYGEEIGLEGVRPAENIRAPMQWADDRSVGFTTSFKLWHPPQTPREINVAAQTDDATSLLSHYRKLIRLRTRSDALRRGTWTPLNTGDPELYACVRSVDTQQMLVIINLGDTRITEYGISAPAGTLRNGGAVERLAEALITSPKIADDGSLTEYKPLPALEPFQTLVVEILP